jgi:Rrf2 family protein
MKFTAQEEYGLRCILHLARHEIAAEVRDKHPPARESGTVHEGASHDGTSSSVRAVPSVRANHEASTSRTVASVGVPEIARAEGMSEPYVGKLFRVLADAGLVESVRGRSGGFRLVRPSEQISVAEVLAALGGRIYEPTTCDRFSGTHSLCVHKGDCSIRSLWAGLELMVDHLLSKTRLRDLVGSERTMREWMQSHFEALTELREGFDAATGTDDRAAPERAAARSNPVELVVFPRAGSSHEEPSER